MGQGSDSMMAPTSFEFLMSVSRLTGAQLVVLFCSNLPVVLFDNPGVSKCLNTLFLLSPRFIVDFTCDSFVARNDSWEWTSIRTEQMYVLTTKKPRVRFGVP